MNHTAQPGVEQDVPTLLASAAVTKASISSQKTIAARRRPEDELQTALEYLADQIRREIQLNPAAWQFCEWKVSFINDSRHGCPPVVEMVHCKRAAA